jgi:hypothetical protein
VICIGLNAAGRESGKPQGLLEELPMRRKRSSGPRSPSVQRVALELVGGAVE